LEKSLIATLVAMLLLSVSAHAIYIKAPANIIVQGEQKDIPIAISNDTEEEQEYQISFSAPIEYTISPISGKLASGKTTIATLSIAPGENLEGSTYEGTLEVEMGEKKAFKAISMIFKENEDEEDEEPEETTGFFSLAGYSATITSLLTPQNALNTLLGTIAAILLIAFIARFVKRLEALK